MRRIQTRRSIWMMGILGIALLPVLALLASLFIPLPPDFLAREALHSMRITDYRGVLLREAVGQGEGRSRWMPLDELSPALIQATIAAEDQRFYHHPGIDPFAIARALADNLRSLSFSSGASTITQQVVKNIVPKAPRSLSAKVKEAWYALRLERERSKREILEEYLNRIPYGAMVIGAESASLFYFHKHARDLSTAEAAFLAALPNAPSRLNPHLHLHDAIQRQQYVLRRMKAQGMITEEDYARAVSQPIVPGKPESVFRAPHVCDMVEKEYSALQAAMVTTTIDVALQEELQKVIDHHLKRLASRHVTNAAVVVIENRTGEVRALIGSGDYFNAPLSGQVNGALALRQPGSAVKPFMYALAFDAGHGAGEIVADIPTAIPDVRGDYVPENYDRKFHGPVSIRTALACSYNVPAVRMLETIGREYFLQTLRLCGFTSLVGSSEYYGYGLTLGNAEVRLIELANAFRIFANGGMWHPWTLVKEARRADGAVVTQPVAGTPHRVYSEESAFLVTDILSDAASRAPAFGSAFRFPFPCAVKTGTTKEYKDNWTIGSTTRYTVGVWAGNFDGSEMRGVSGVAGAGGIFSDIMLLLHSAPYGLPPSEWKKPASLERVQICPRSGLLPGENCPHTTSEWFVHGHVPRARCRVHQAYRVRDEHGIASRRVYEVYGPEYAEYMERSGMTRVPQGAEPADAPLAQGSKIRRLAISSPNQGDLFKIDPSLRREYQTIRVRGFIPEGARDVRLVVDGADERVFTEAGVVWTLEKGVHQFQLIGIINDEPLRSRVVHITVE